MAIETVLRMDGVITRRAHPELAGALAWLVRRGELTAVLPGVYAPPDAATQPITRMRAAMSWDHDAVLCGEAAANLTFWPGVRVAVVDVALLGRRRAASPGFDISHRPLPPEVVVERGAFRVTAPALTALDLCLRHGGDGIDQALRTRAATLDGMRAALGYTRWRPGNTLKRTLLLDSHDEPWSAAERQFHRLLRDAGINGWQTNYAVNGPGQMYYLDVAFPECRLAIEIDGRLHETDQGVFESDRWRQNWLVMDGWRVLRFTWTMLTKSPEYVLETIRAALAAQRRS